MSCGRDWLKSLQSTCDFCPLRPWNWRTLHKWCLQYRVVPFHSITFQIMSFFCERTVPKQQHMARMTPTTYFCFPFLHQSQTISHSQTCTETDLVKFIRLQATKWQMMINTHQHTIYHEFSDLLSIKPLSVLTVQVLISLVKYSVMF